MGAPAPPLLRRGATVGAICLALAAPACVVPVGPQFQDPPATQNYEPRILGAQPALGERVTGTSFRVTVQDPNVGDNLYVRFMADFPPVGDNQRFLQDTTIRHHDDGTLLAEDVTLDVKCNAVVPLPSHQITVIVADRKFLLDDKSPMQPANPLQLPDDARRVMGTWTLDLECPP
jgi:hypothetical protein